jgi:transcriptional regulator GlxA family with amidase domain
VSTAPIKTIAIVTLDGFNEIDSLVALHLFGRASEAGLSPALVGPTPSVTSSNGVRVTGIAPLAMTSRADAVLIGSGQGTRAFVDDPEQLRELRLDPSNQVIGSQCSGSLVLQHLGVSLAGGVCADVVTRPVLEATGVDVRDDAFHVEGNVATAGGCLASQYLAFWMIERLSDARTAEAALTAIAPVGMESQTVSHVATVVRNAQSPGADLRARPHTPIRPGPA